MYKKGDIPITILVIGIVAVCAFALISFISSSIITTQSFSGISEMEKLNSQIDEYYFYKQQGLNDEKINSLLEIDNKVLSVEKSPSFRLPWIKQKFLFSAEYRLP